MVDVTSGEATVQSLGDGATADLNYSGKMAVAELWIDGVKMPDGRYDTARLPARFSGTGAGRGTCRSA